MALPFLPGNSFNTNLGRTYFSKPHHFEYSNDSFLLIDKNRPNHSVLPKGDGPGVPAWVAFDKQVLSFDAYFQESVTERRGEQYAVHHCKVYFYLEDDSIQVVEPKSLQAGAPQGTLMRRQRVPRPPPQDQSFYTVEDFNLGAELQMHRRTFKICNCDEFTANFLRKLGVRLNPPVSMPGDPYTENRKATEGAKNPLRPYEKRDTLKQFLDHDRHVLRFYCFWDDRENEFGDPREMVLHYYLADDTVEVREIVAQNSGRDAAPMFLHRCKLPRALEPMHKPGELADRTVLNVFGPMGKGGRYILDNLKTGEVKQEFYRDTDLVIGAYVNVWGRRFLICDCDEFTKEYYRTKYGLTDFTPVRVDKGVPARQPSGQAQAPPGVEGDDLPPTIHRLVPFTVPPKRSFAQYMSPGVDLKVLRFLAKLNANKGPDVERRFIISCFLSDNTIVVYEPPVRNSGMIGGKFLERSKLLKPGQVVVPGGKPPKYYTAQDMFVGVGLELNKHPFILIDADEYAYNYMEQHARQYPQSDISLVMAKLVELTRDVRMETLVASLEGVTHLPTLDFSDLVKEMSAGGLTDQEIITLARYYQDREEESVSVEAVLSMLQEQMKRAGFEDFRVIEERCMHFDGARTGALDAGRIRTVFRSVNVPVQDDMLRAFIAGLAERHGGGRIDYAEMVRLLNWRLTPTEPLRHESSAGDDAWFGNKSASLVQQVNMQALLQDLMGVKRT